MSRSKLVSEWYRQYFHRQWTLYHKLVLFWWQKPYCVRTVMNVCQPVAESRESRCWVHVILAWWNCSFKDLCTCDQAFILLSLVFIRTRQTMLRAEQPRRVFAQRLLVRIVFPIFEGMHRTKRENSRIHNDKIIMQNNTVPVSYILPYPLDFEENIDNSVVYSPRSMFRLFKIQYTASSKRWDNVRQKVEWPSRPTEHILKVEQLQGSSCVW